MSSDSKLQEELYQRVWDVLERPYATDSWLDSIIRRAEKLLVLCSDCFYVAFLTDDDWEAELIVVNKLLIVTRLECLLGNRFRMSVSHLTYTKERFKKILNIEHIAQPQ